MGERSFFIVFIYFIFIFILFHIMLKQTWSPDLQITVSLGKWFGMVLENFS